MSHHRPSYLPFATSFSPHVSWGDSNSLAGFKRLPRCDAVFVYLTVCCRHVLREEYGTFKLTADHGIDGRLVEGLYHFVLQLLREWTLLTALLVPGVLSLCRQRGGQCWFVSTCISSVVFYLAAFHYMANIELYSKPDQQNIVRRFWIMPFIVRSPASCSALSLLTSRAGSQPHHSARLSRGDGQTLA
jgi:hypothetical protein